MSGFSLLSKAHLLSLKMGDTFETEGLFQGVTKTPMRWVLVGGNLLAGEYLFDLTYFNVKFCEAVAKINGSAVSVERV